MIFYKKYFFLSTAESVRNIFESLKAAKKKKDFNEKILLCFNEIGGSFQFISASFVEPSQLLLPSSSFSPEIMKK